MSSWFGVGDWSWFSTSWHISLAVWQISGRLSDSVHDLLDSIAANVSKHFCYKLVLLTNNKLISSTNFT